MPLPPSKTQDTRELYHTRTITCDGYRRDDNLWEIEGRITDIKAHAFDNDWRGTVTPPDPLHDMSLRFVVDNEMTIKEVDAVTDKSPFPACPHITSNFQRLVGLQIIPGFTKKVRQLLGGIQGCTHLVDLINPVSTTAFQTIVPVLAREKGLPPMPAADDENADGKSPRPPLLNSCHAFSSKGDVVKKRWPDWYDGPSETE